jgi:hypothetical protein
MHRALPAQGLIDRLDNDLEHAITNECHMKVRGLTCM